MTYYPVKNDVIGGWDVSLHNKPVSEHDIAGGEGTLAWGMNKADAAMVANALNLVDGLKGLRDVIDELKALEGI